MKRRFNSIFLVSVVLLLLLTSIAVSSNTISGNTIQLAEDQILYSEPSLDSTIVATLNKGDVFVLIDTNEEWNKISNWKYSGYIRNSIEHESYIHASNVEDSTNVKLALITAALNLRENPDINSKSLSIMRKGTLVIVHDTSNSPWWFVESNGNFGYSHSDYLEVYDSISEDEVPISIYTTKFSTKKEQEGRVFNITKAANMLDSTLVSKGETFSLLDIIAPITKFAGYKEAPEYRVKNGEAFVTTGYGGGVCQVSTTLYNTFLFASNNLNLELIERHTHALPVSYVPQGMDATISYSSGKDFRFKNNSAYNITIRTYVSDTGCISTYFTIKNSDF